MKMTRDYIFSKGTKFQNDVLVPTFSFFLIVLTLFFSIRVYEFAITEWVFKVDWPSNIFWEYSLYFDFVSSITFGFYLLVLNTILYLFGKKSKWPKIVLYTLIVLLQVFLTTYYVSSGRLLGDGILRFSFSEQLLIAKTGTSFLTIFTIVFLAVMSFFYFRFIDLLKNKLIKKGKYIRIVVSVFCLFIILIWNNNKAHIAKTKGLLYFSSISEYEFGNSRISFFIESLSVSMSSKSEVNYDEKELQNCINNYQSRNLNHVDQKYPYASKPIKNSTLSPYFIKSETAPNIVFIIVESLSTPFSGHGNYLGSYTPFLDSLADHSLCWFNTISCAERTYGVLPHILGSLPYGRNSTGIINDRNIGTISHNTIVSALADNYSTSFFYGGYGQFDHTNPFLKINKNRDFFTYDELHKTYPNENKYAWGYSDSIAFKSNLNYIKKQSTPFLSVILTIGIHAPFDQVPTDMEAYVQSKSAQHDRRLKRKEIAASIYLTDDNIKNYLEEFKNDPSYDNTIFVITGDHCIGNEISLRSPIDYFKIPLIIYSPLLKKTQKFPAIVTHRDILPSLIGLLDHNYGVKINEPMSILGQQLDTSSTYRSLVSTQLVLFRDHQADFIEGNYFLSQGNIYEITDTLMNAVIVKNDSIKRLLNDRVREAKVLNEYTLSKNRLISK